jgi:hypothetical protein
MTPDGFVCANFAAVVFHIIDAISIDFYSLIRFNSMNTTPLNHISHCGTLRNTTRRCRFRKRRAAEFSGFDNAFYVANQADTFPHDLQSFTRLINCAKSKEWFSKTEATR